MASTLQIRHVPEEVHRRLKARAALAGLSLSDYLLAEMVRLASRPTPQEIRERLESLPPLAMPESAEVMIRADRDSR